jgi:amino acid adenylation domain-containing protein
MTQAQYQNGEMPPAAWQGGRAPYPRDAAVHRVFEEVAAATPDAVALIWDGGMLTYAELNGRANGLAGYLAGRGAGKRERVGVCIERSPELLLALLGVLKCGGCYVPLDPGYPNERLKMMAEEAELSMIVTTRELEGGIAGIGARVIRLDEVDETGAGMPSDETGAMEPAYIMFTSGSTGRPKGVVVPHRAIVRLVRGQEYVALGPEETFLQFAPASFDASTLEIWGPLLNGGRVAIAPAGALSLEQIGGAIRDMGVTSMWLTSGLFNLMADEQLEAFRPLRQLLAGGDVLSMPHVRKVMSAYPELRLINGYGPTESTTFACCDTITGLDLAMTGVPIGRPIANTTVRVLDDGRRAVTIGTPGELYIGGDGLALGYWRQPELTAEKFVTMDGERFYRTGDRVQWLASGVIQFLGRQDHQVKVRGYRVELGEIESALAEEPGVMRSAVVALGDGADKQLAAYYAGTAGSGALRESLRKRLPDYMVPGFFTRLDSLPLTANGKVDRAKLPRPHEAQPNGAEAGSGRPLTKMEETISAIWAQVLAIPAPDVNANFFDIGGTSLKLVEAHSRLVRSLRRVIPVTVLFQYPAIAMLAAYLSASSSDNIVSQSRLTAAADRARLQRDALARKQLSQKVP